MYKNETHVHNLGTTVLVLSAVSIGLGVISNLTRFSGHMMRGMPNNFLNAFLGPLAIVMVVFFMLWHYHNWELLDEDLRKTTPGRAVGFLFIPFYNFYWIFVSFIWLWEGLNRMGERYMKDDWVEMPRGIPIAFAILTLLSMIPFVYIGAGVLTILLILTTLSRVKELYNALPPGKKVVPESPENGGSGEV